jgi:hypothetical protein
MKAVNIDVLFFKRKAMTGIFSMDSSLKYRITDDLLIGLLFVSVRIK